MKEASNNWNNGAAYALGVYRIITRSLGIWPLNRRDLSTFQVLFVVVLQVSMIGSLLGELTVDCDVDNDTVIIISLIVCSILTLMKIGFIHFNHDKMEEVIESAVNDWTHTTRNAHAQDVMENYAKFARSICIIQMVFSYVTTLPMILGALPHYSADLNSTINSTEILVKPLPLQTICFYGEMSTMIYSAVFFLQSLQVLSTCTGNVGCDCYFFGITLHLAGQFECLALALEDLRLQGNRLVNQKYIADLVERHIKLLKLGSHLEDTFNIVLLFQMAANVIQICFMGIQMIISLRIGDVVTIINVLIIISIFNFQIFLYCYAGDNLSSAAFNLNVAAYFCNWYEFAPSARKDVAFIVMRSNKTFSLTAGKVLDMNLDNFKNVIKTVGSYFSILQAMFDS